MKKQILKTRTLKIKFAVYALSIMSLALVSCNDDDEEENKITPLSGTTLSGKIITDTRLESGKTYTLDGIVYVNSGATLKIEEGVTIKALKGKTALVITRGAKIEAIGSASKPIVFTSNESSPARGDWGGIVLLGKAKTNASFSGQAGVGEMEGGINTTDNLGLYGGTDDADNSGTLKYVRVEYGGYPFEVNKEINSFTFGAVGSATTLEYLEAYYGGDDAFEWFGGSVNAKYLIAYKGLDDDFDTDNGFSGKVQFAIGFRDANVADVSKSNGFESDNDASSSATEPFTQATFSNITLVGPYVTNATINTNYQSGAHLRRNTKQSIYNSLIMGYKNGFTLDGSGVKANALSVVNNYVAKCDLAFDGAGTGGYTDDEAKTYLEGTGNKYVANTDFLSTTLTGDKKYFTPASTLPVSPTFNDSKVGTGFTQVSYIGAVKDNNDTWYSGWARFDN